MYPAEVKRSLQREGDAMAVPAGVLGQHVAVSSPFNESSSWGSKDERQSSSSGR